MKHRVFYFVLIFISLMALFYMMGAFIAVSFDPFKWSDMARSFYAIIGTMIAFSMAVMLTMKID